MCLLLCFSRLAPLLSVYLFLDGTHCSSLLSQALCIDNVKEILIVYPRLKKYSFLYRTAFSPPLLFFFYFKNSIIWNGSIFFMFHLSVFIYVLVCHHVSFSVLLKRIKQMASINLNLMCISFADVFLACTAVCQVITLSKQAINHPLFSPKVE